MQEKIPIIGLEEEQVRFENADVQYIARNFYIKQGSGSKGVWEYCKQVDPNKVFLNVLLISKNAEGKRVLIVKEEKQPCTYEGKALKCTTSSVIDNSDETYLEKAKDSVGILGLKNVEVLSCSEAAYFTDPWKSD